MPTLWNETNGGVQLYDVATINRLYATNKALVEALEWAFPLASMALEDCRQYRLKCGHNDIGAGTKHIGLWPAEIAERDKARAALEIAKEQP